MQHRISDRDKFSEEEKDSKFFNVWFEFLVRFLISLGINFFLILKSFFYKNQKKQSIRNMYF